MRSISVSSVTMSNVLWSSSRKTDRSMPSIEEPALAITPGLLAASAFEFMLAIFGLSLPFSSSILARMRRLSREIVVRPVPAAAPWCSFACCEPPVGCAAVPLLLPAGSLDWAEARLPLARKMETLFIIIAPPFVLLVNAAASALRPGPAPSFGCRRPNGFCTFERCLVLRAGLSFSALRASESAQTSVSDCNGQNGDGGQMKREETSNPLQHHWKPRNAQWHTLPSVLLPAHLTISSRTSSASRPWASCTTRLSTIGPFVSSNSCILLKMHLM
uniref:Uncharacterized protein n=1 Tax=Anopheles merus TaxID=30066 RepID=A0A182UX03_ANOME